MEDLVSLITSKAIISNLTNRLCTVISIENDMVRLEMENNGKGYLPLLVVQKGFTALLDNKTLIKTFILREIPYENRMSEKEIYNTSIKLGEILRERFKDITDKECFIALKELYL